MSKEAVNVSLICTISSKAIFFLNFFTFLCQTWKILTIIKNLVFLNHTAITNMKITHLNLCLEVRVDNENNFDRYEYVLVLWNIL